jgi:hypothetical protein
MTNFCGVPVLRTLSVSILYVCFLGSPLLAFDNHENLSALREKLSKRYSELLSRPGIIEEDEAAIEQSRFNIALYDKNNDAWNGQQGQRRIAVTSALLNHITHESNEENDVELQPVIEQQDAEAEKVDKDDDAEPGADESKANEPETETAIAEKEENEEGGCSGGKELTTEEAIALLDRFVNNDKSYQDVSASIFSQASAVGWAVAGVGCCILALPCALATFIADLVICEGESVECPPNETWIDYLWCRDLNGTRHFNGHYVKDYSEGQCFIALSSTFSALLVSVCVPIFGGVLYHASEYAIRKATANHKNTRNKRLRHLNQKNMDRLVELTGMKMLPQIVKFLAK